MNDITVIIPTRNEIKHIERSVTSALRLTPNVIVVDSNSQDGTIETAERLGAKVIQYEWTAESNFSKKLNWAINEYPINSKWVIRLDADEYFMDDCVKHLKEEIHKLSDDVNGCTLIRRVFFLGRWMKHSNEYPKTTMRVLRVGHAYYEDRWLDEHVDLMGGKAAYLDMNIVDDSHISLMDWISKHNGYSNKEAVELINSEIGLFHRQEDLTELDKNAQLKKRDKSRYNKMPKYWRAFFFFCYRYFFKLGFLDGKEGFLWNFFQCWWYRTLADAKVDEIYRHCGKDKNIIAEYVRDNFGLDISSQIE